MSTPTPKGQYVYVGSDPHSFTLWFDQKAGDSIHLTSGDPRFLDENGERPGLRVVFSSNPNSADYNPGNFNRSARVLKEAGKAAPEEVPLESRRLADRPKVKAQLKTVQPSSTDPAQFGWQVCNGCGCVIISTANHSCHAS
jgi:hypothetical protein